MGMTYTAKIVFIQITWNAGRTVEVKKAFYKAIADGIHEKPVSVKKTCGSTWRTSTVKTGHSLVARCSTRPSNHAFIVNNDLAAGSKGPSL
jgi:hypothetical protein